MRFFSIVIQVIFLLTTSPTLALVASPTEKPVGWASVSGGTSGGSGGTIDTASDLTTLNNLLKQNGAKTIFVRGTITGKVSVAADNKSLLGLPGAKIYGSLQVSNRKNIIVRNLTVQGLPCFNYDSCKSGDDAVHIQGSLHVWMDHLAVLDGQDGNMDCNDTANYITVSWCKFNYTDKTKPHKFSNLIGSADSLAVCESRLNITYHHCWWGNWVSERQPRTRYGKIHVADNFFNSDSSSYCTNAGYHASVMAEYNVYLNQKNPIAPDANCYGCASRGNVFTNCSGTTAGLGTAFNPASYYDTSFLDPTNGLQASLTSTSSGAGPTLTWGATTALYPCKVPAMSMTVPVSIQRTIAGNIRIINRCANPLSARIMDLTGKTIQTIRMITPGQVADIFLSSPHVKAGLLVLSVSGNKRLLVVPILE